MGAGASKQAGIRRRSDLAKSVVLSLLLSCYYYLIGDSVVAQLPLAEASSRSSDRPRRTLPYLVRPPNTMIPPSEDGVPECFLVQPRRRQEHMCDSDGEDIADDRKRGNR